MVTIEQSYPDSESLERQQQDDVDLQLTVCVIITSAVFVGCNLPNFIIFILRFVYRTGLRTIGLLFIYISVFAIFIAHTITYFIFNHLAACLFHENSP